MSAQPIDRKWKIPPKLFMPGRSLLFAGKAIPIALTNTARAAWRNPVHNHVAYRWWWLGPDPAGAYYVGTKGEA